ncbi:MAG: ATP-binding protein [Oligoflexales bacterium]|nr:ATP-binding protein [Oligoflexales bacterium]
MNNALADKIQIWGFEGDVVVFADASLGAGWSFSTLDSSCLEDESINQIKGSVVNFLNALPTELEIQFVQKVEGGNKFTLEEHKKLKSDMAHNFSKKLCDDRVNRLACLDSRGELPRQVQYVFIRYKPGARSNTQKTGIKLFSKKLSEKSHWISEELRKFERIVRDFEASLQTLDLKAKRLKQSELADVVYWQWNPSRSVNLKNYSPEYVRSSLVFTDAVIDERGFCLGDVCHRVVSLKLLPEMTFAGMANQMQSLPFDTDLYLSIYVPDQHDEMESLKSQRRVAFSMASRNANQVRDLESQNKFDDLESILEDLVAQGEKIFYFSLNVIVRAKDENQLDDRVSAVLMKIRELGGSEGMEETHASFDIFSGIAIPNARSRERRKRLKTSNLADFVPLFGQWSGHEVPRTLFTNDSGQLLKFDPFSSELSNANQLVSGGSGSGKSFLTNTILLQTLKEDPLVFIIDIGGSYQKMTRLLGGQYIPLGLDQGISLNPFDLPSDTSVPSHHKIKFLLSLIETLSKDDSITRLPKLVLADVESAIKNLYEGPKQKQNLSGLKQILGASSDPEIRKIARILNLWTGATPFGSLLDQPSNIKLDRRIVCFDLKGLDTYPDLQAASLLIITDLVWRAVQQNKTSMKFVVFDECWKLLENEAGAAFLAENFRTFRKYFASAIAISQTMDDFANSKVAQAILPNASIKWILNQKGVKKENLKQVLSLNTQEIAVIDSLIQKRGEYSEAFLMAGENRSIVRIESTPLEYWICTTDPRDLAAIEQTMSLNPSLTELEIMELLTAKYPRGVAQGVAQGERS